MTVYKYWREHLKSAINRRGKTIASAAREMGLSKYTLWGAINANRMPLTDHYVKIIQWIGLPLDGVEFGNDTAYQVKQAIARDIDLSSNQKAILCNYFTMIYNSTIGFNNAVST